MKKIMHDSRDYIITEISTSLFFSLWYSTYNLYESFLPMTAHVLYHFNIQIVLIMIEPKH